MRSFIASRYLNVSKDVVELSAFACVGRFEQDHLVGHPIYVPRRARKRILALAGLIRLQMKAEQDKATKAMEVRRGSEHAHAH